MIDAVGNIVNVGDINVLKLHIYNSILKLEIIIILN